MRSFADREKEMNISLPKAKEKRQLTWAVLETTWVWLQLRCWWSRPNPAKAEGRGAHCADDTLCDPPPWSDFPSWAPRATPPSVVRPEDECLARACPRVRGLEGQRVLICLSVSSPSTKDFELLWERGCVNAAQLQGHRCYRVQEWRHHVVPSGPWISAGSQGGRWPSRLRSQDPQVSSQGGTSQETPPEWMATPALLR